MSRRTFAAFDFDGTITRRDTLVPFLVAVAGRGPVLGALAAESVPLALAAAGRGDRDLAKERVLTRVLGGVPYGDVEAAGKAYAARITRHAITDDARERIEWHRREGHDIAIVSASLDVYLDEIGNSLGIAHVLCTSLDTDARGLCTGQLRGANCRGAEKATRLRALLGDDDVELWAYGNSRGDDAMLALAEHPVRFRRGRSGPQDHHR